MNYTKTTNFTAKDSLSSGDPNKVIRGSEFDTEFNNIAVAVATKIEANNTALTGTTTVNNITVSGTFSGTIAGGTY